MNGRATQLHDQAPEPDIEAAQRHFELFEKLAEGQGGWFVLCGITEDPASGKEEITSRPIENKHTNTGSPSTRLLNAALALADDGPSNIYLSPCLLASKPQGRSRGNQSDVMRALAFPQDFDGGKGGDHLRQCPIAPHYVVQTSTGNIQAWWIPDAPVKKGDAAKIMAALTRACSQDAEKADRPDHCSATLHQIMRVPGFVNWPNARKRKAGRVPELATVTHPYEGGSIRVKDLAALDDRYPQSPASATNDASPAEWTTGPVPGAAPIADDAALIERALASTSARATFGDDASFRDLWEANSEALAAAFPSAGGYDASRADSALATRLAWWTGKDCVRIERLMWQSGLVREKWQREGAGASNYLRHTILGAVPFEDSVYTGKPGDTDEVPDWVAELNRDHMLVNFNGRAVVLRSIYNENLGRREFEKQERVDFCALHPELVKVTKGDDETKWAEKGKTWLKHPQSRTYKGGVAFAPKKELPADKLNLWQGYGVDPKPGDWSRFRALIRDVIAAGDPRIDAYVMGWMARMVQEPDTPGETALVLRGGKGIGKTKLGEWLDRLWGQHAFVTGSANQVVGNFNLHLQDCVFLFADEAFFAGDKRHESTLKMLVTDKTIPIEGKGLNAVRARNYLHILMASNKQWVVPASADERRYCVLDVSEHRRGDKPYFRAIDEQMENGGAEAMLHDLLEYDLSGFEVRDVPDTEALGDQKRLSLEGPEAWLFGVLQEGRIGIWSWDENGLQIPKENAYQHYCEYSKQIREYRPAHNTVWGRALKSALGSTLHSVRPGTGEDRRRQFRFAPLEQCRDAFTESMSLGHFRWDDSCDDEDGVDVFS